jgi:hypothetical protein
LIDFLIAKKTNYPVVFDFKELPLKEKASNHAPQRGLNPFYQSRQRAMDNSCPMG